MGLYMIVVLKKAYKNDLFIELLNQELTAAYGANTSPAFLTWQSLEKEAAYFNAHPEGLQQLGHWQRPLSAAQLSAGFYWYRHGEFHFKLSGDPSSDEARDAVAVCKWVNQTKGRYIDKTKSACYDPQKVRDYLDDLFQQDGYNLQELWKST